jgi:hypothetical protein
MTFVALAALSGCKDFLVEEPILSQSNELTLATYEGLDKATLGAYAPLASASWYGNDFVLRTELATSNGKKWIGSTYDSGRCNDLYNLVYNDNNTSGVWSAAYYVISAANNVMDNLEGKETAEVTAQDLNNLKAECLFLRALSHFDLVRVYAQPYCFTSDASHPGVPVVLKTDANAKPARETVKDVYAQIEADLLEAESIIDPAYVRANVADNKVSLLGNINLRHYVEHYYGISNDVNELFGLDGSGINVYTSQAFDINVQPFYNFTRDVSAGVYLRARGERMVKFNEPLQACIDACKQKFGTAGWDDYFMWGIGLQFMYDSRDNIFYPQKFSNFLKFNATTYSKQLGSSYSFTGINFDFRQYIPTWLGQVLAWQVKFETALGDELPFQMLPTVGGSDNIRGIRERKFIDNTMFEFQVEYRIPIWWRLKAAVFCSVGDVFDIYNPSIVKPKVGYGVGLRCRLNDARVHLRVDVAGNNYGEWKFYITATEAF